MNDFKSLNWDDFYTSDGYSRFIYVAGSLSRWQGRDRVRVEVPVE